MFEVEYFWKDGVKEGNISGRLDQEGWVNANLVLCDWPDFKYQSSRV